MQTHEPSRLCKDIYELEKDFRYNLFLLKVRETEIERYKSQNGQLTQSIQHKESELVVAHKKLSELQGDVKRINKEMTNMKISCEQIVRGLSEAEKQAKEQLERNKRAAEIRLKQMTTEMERKYMTEMTEKDAEFQCCRAQMDDLLQNEIYAAQKIKTRLQELTDEKLKLHAQFQEKQSFYISKMSVLESELVQSKSDRMTLDSVLEMSKNQSSCLVSELERVHFEWEQYKKESDATDQNSKRNFEDLSLEKQNVCQQLELCKKELKSCREYSSKLVLEQDQLKHELQQSNVHKCSIIEHKNIDFIIKQNSVLQEVIKSMRKERNGEEIEIKMDRLEELVAVLKESMLNQVT